MFLTSRIARNTRKLYKLMMRNHSIKCSEKKIFVERVIDEPVDRAQCNSDIGKFMRPDVEIVVHNGIRLHHQGNLKIFVGDDPIWKQFAVTHHHFLVSSFFLRNKGLQLIDGLIVEFKKPYFFCCLIMMNG